MSRLPFLLFGILAGLALAAGTASAADRTGAGQLPCGAATLATAVAGDELPTPSARTYLHAWERALQRIEAEYTAAQLSSDGAPDWVTTGSIR